MLNPNLYYSHLSNTEYNIYSKHFILDQIGLEGQKRLKQAKILILGAGGLGCPAMLYLVSTGIGTLGIVDEDFIDISNLNRQILYDLKNITSEKITVAKNKLTIVNPYCNIITYHIKLNRYNALNIINKYDIVLDCTDNFETRHIIDTSCFNLHKTHIYGAVDKFEGQISVFNYKNNLRYSDIYQYNTTQQILNKNCNSNGVLSSITGIIGILQATEAIKITLGIGKIIAGKLLTYNLLNYQIKILPLYKTNINRIHPLHKQLKKNTKFQFDKNLITKYINQTIIIDIRDIHEFKKEHLKYSIHIPLKYLNNKKIITFIKKNLEYKIILIYCQSQVRSITAYNILKINMIRSMIIN